VREKARSASVRRLERDEPEALIRRRVDDAVCVVEQPQPFALVDRPDVRDACGEVWTHAEALSLGTGRSAAGGMGPGEDEPAVPVVPRAEGLEEPECEQAVLVPEVRADAQEELLLRRLGKRAGPASGDLRRQPMIDTERYDPGAVLIDEVFRTRIGCSVL